MYTHQIQFSFSILFKIPTNLHQFPVLTIQLDPNLNSVRDWTLLNDNPTPLLNKYTNIWCTL